MTVKELIDKLSQFPPEAVVIHDMYSDYCELDEPKLIRAEDKEIMFRNGRYQRYYPFYSDPNHQMYKADEQFSFVTVVHFDGN